MKTLVKKLIRVYQKIPGPWHSACRHTPTCSNYMIGSIEEWGLLKGIYLGIIRILKCNPWGTYGYDPVKKRK
jgi:putative membrane protein insertion efficiency factor